MSVQEAEFIQGLDPAFSMSRLKIPSPVEMISCKVDSTLSMIASASWYPFQAATVLLMAVMDCKSELEHLLR